MPETSATLIQFRDDELIFDENETKDILKFFWPESSPRIDKMVVTNDVRAFAQGLVVEGVDSSYAMGFVQDMLWSVLNPGKGVRSFLTKLGKKALARWFKHAKSADLHQAKIAQVIRNKLAVNFATTLGVFVNTGSASLRSRRFAAVPIHIAGSVKSRTLWG